jgi:hypothetical protein
VYRSWAIPCAGRDVYYRRHRAQWLDKIREAGVRRRAERLYEQLDMLQHLRLHAGLAGPTNIAISVIEGFERHRDCDSQ